MTTLELLAEVRRRGATLWAEGGALKVIAPRGALLPSLVAELAAKKPDILAAIEFQPIDAWEWIEERAAILEVLGGLTRDDADARAFEFWFKTFVEGTGREAWRRWFPCGVVNDIGASSASKGAGFACAKRVSR